MPSPMNPMPPLNPVDSSVPVPVRRPLLLAASALKSGVPGAAAAACQVTSFMWLSTTAAFQYRSGFAMSDAFRYLYNQGGVRRFYNGIFPTIAHTTLLRFADTSVNNFMLAHAPTDSIPLKTGLATCLAGTWRAAMIPLETLRANMQVNGNRAGLKVFLKHYQTSGIRGLYVGGTASVTAGVIGYFPFFYTVNMVSNAVPLGDDASTLAKIGRNGGMGFLAALSSDVLSNGFKVIATNRQTCDKGLSYVETARKIMNADGVMALLTRGLKTRLLSNACQGAVFVYVWKEIEVYLRKAKGEET